MGIIIPILFGRRENTEDEVLQVVMSDLRFYDFYDNLYTAGIFG